MWNRTNIPSVVYDRMNAVVSLFGGFDFYTFTMVWDAFGLGKCYKNLYDANNFTDAALDTCTDALRLSAVTNYHPSGTASQGHVVDQDFKVYGTENLRVVDASVFGTNWNINPQASIAAIARMAAQLMIHW